MKKRRIVISIIVVAITILILTAWVIQTQISDLQMQISEIQNQNDQLESQNSNLQNQTLNLQTRNSQLQTQITELQSRNNELESHNNDLQNPTITLQEQNSQMNDRISELLKQLIVAQFNSTFADYRAYIEPYIFDNGTIYELKENNYSGTLPYDTIESVSNYAYALMQYYKQAKNAYELAKIETWFNSYITNPFFIYDYSGIPVHYLPQMAYNDTLVEPDHTAKLTMYAAVTALDLYEETGNETYKPFADEVAYEARNYFPVIDNATDLAYSWDYVGKSDTTGTIGINRMCSIAWFFSRYASINATYATYVPLIAHWVMRPQLANGGLPYSAGQGESPPYTAYAIYFLLKAYENVPSAFTVELKTQMQNAVNRVIAYGSTNNNYLRNFVYSACLIQAVKCGFTAQDLTEYITACLTAGLDNLVLAENGVHCENTNYGRRWSMYFLTALFSEYPISEVFT